MKCCSDNHAFIAALVRLDRVPDVLRRDGAFQRLISALSVLYHPCGKRIIEAGSFRTIFWSVRKRNSKGRCVCDLHIIVQMRRSDVWFNAGDAFVRRIDIAFNGGIHRLIAWVFHMSDGSCSIEPSGIGIDITDIDPAHLIVAIFRAAVVEADGKGVSRRKCRHSHSNSHTKRQQSCKQFSLQFHN